jgi:hypothetical protein
VPAQLAAAESEDETVMFARNRDSNELEIVQALLAAGASVQRLNETGTPDLLVGYRGETFLLEVKRPGKNVYVAKQGHHEADERGLARTQQLWWDRWRGRTPVVVTSKYDALVAIGAEAG